MRVTKIKELFLITWGILLLSSIPVISLAQIPQTINYQGYLTDKTSGDPINNSALEMTFSIYDVPTGGTALWWQTQTIQVNQGNYNVVLGGGTTPKPIDVPFDKQYYLGVKVGTDPEMTTRQPFTSVPYAINAGYLGEFCWQLTPAGSTGTGFLKLSMTRVNANNYTVNGYSTNTSTTATGAINGNAVVIGSEMLLTLTESHMDSFSTSISVYNLILDSTSYNGTFRVIGRDYNYSSGFEPLNHTSGSVTYVACP